MDDEKTEGNSELDGWSSSRLVFKKPTAVTGQHPDDEFYNMSHQNRGIALIFNHRYFDSLYFKERKGTEFDRDAMAAVLKKLKFHVEIYNDLTKAETFEALKIVSKMDHSQNDCLVVAVMTHGRSFGRLCARDNEYTTHDILESFSGDNCPSLAGKPKLFFIQACRGENTDPGVQLKVESDSTNANQTIVYSIPAMADILIMYATVEGYYAWRDTTKGSCFIQALVKKLEEHHDSRDLMSILTVVNREVAIGFLSNSLNEDFHEKKEMCSIVSMLTRYLYFEFKNETKNLFKPETKELRYGLGVF